ncbi:MAG: ankyrin repeat domain-containing protein [Ignavibacteriales bacterium]|nr:ankyrin repeat domain-containing protein [Ignavibacteriales bacterium]
MRPRDVRLAGRAARPDQGHDPLPAAKVLLLRSRRDPVRNGRSEIGAVPGGSLDSPRGRARILIGSRSPSPLIALAVVPPAAPGEAARGGRRRDCAARRGRETSISSARYSGDSGESVKGADQFRARPFARARPLPGAAEIPEDLLNAGAAVDSPAGEEGPDGALSGLAARRPRGRHHRSPGREGRRPQGRKDKSGRTAVHAAAETGQARCSRSCLGHGCAVESRDSERADASPSGPAKPATMHAARLLAEHGAPVDTADGPGETPLHLAALAGDCDIVALLPRTRGLASTPGTAAGRHLCSGLPLRSRVAAARALIAAGADIAAVGGTGRTALGLRPPPSPSASWRPSSWPSVKWGT